MHYSIMYLCTGSEKNRQVYTTIELISMLLSFPEFLAKMDKNLTTKPIVAVECPGEKHIHQWNLFYDTDFICSSNQPAKVGLCF